MLFCQYILTFSSQQYRKYFASQLLCEIPEVDMSRMSDILNWWLYWQNQILNWFQPLRWLSDTAQSPQIRFEPSGNLLAHLVLNGSRSNLQGCQTFSSPLPLVSCKRQKESWDMKFPRLFSCFRTILCVHYSCNEWSVFGLTGTASVLVEWILTFSLYGYWASFA